MSEEVLLRRTSSQVVNFAPFLIAFILIVAFVAGGMVISQPLVFIGAAFPVLFLVWRLIEVRCRVYELTTQRLRIVEGILNKRDDEMELYRIKDTTLDMSILERMVGAGTLTLVTSDRSHPEVVLQSIGSPQEFREVLRKNVERLRDEKRTREIDFEGGDME